MPEVHLSVPDAFTMPEFYRDAPPESIARILLAGPHMLEGAARVEDDEREAVIRGLRETIAQLRREQTDLVRSAGERAAELAAPLVEQARKAGEVETQGLRAQLEREHLRSRELAALQAEVKDLGVSLRGSNAIKGTIGENQVLHQVAVLCPDSQVEPRAREDHCGDGLWTRHFGSSHLSMRCMLEVKNVERLRAEEFTKFYSDIDSQAKIGLVNSAILVSLRPATLPVTNTRVRYSAYFALDWRGSIPIIMVSNINSNPDLLSIAMATMQHVWQFGERVGALGAEHTASDDATKIQSLALLVNNFVNEQFSLYTQEITTIDKTARHLAELTRDNERRARLAQAQVENISTRLAEAMGDWVQLRETSADKATKKRRRGGVAVPKEAMTADQRAVVDACVAWQVANERDVRSAGINTGEVPGVTKHQVDSLFGNFTSLRLTVQAEAAKRKEKGGS
jgi:hypothetical protein